MERLCFRPGPWEAELRALYQQHAGARGAGGGARWVDKLDAWLKNTPIGFYAIEYARKKGEHPKRGLFSPDLFIKQGDWTFVMEIKEEGWVDNAFA